MDRTYDIGTGWRRVSWAVVLALGVVGCGAQKAPVSGRVRFDGQPLPSGTVLFHGIDGRVEHALISRDGSYRVDDAPLGAVRITVRSHAPAPLGFPHNHEPPPAATAGLPSAEKEQRDGKYVIIPLRYLDPEQSGLVYDVRAGAQTHDIELQP